MPFIEKKKAGGCKALSLSDFVYNNAPVKLFHSFQVFLFNPKS